LLVFYFTFYTRLLTMNMRLNRVVKGYLSPLLAFSVPFISPQYKSVLFPSSEGRNNSNEDRRGRWYRKAVEKYKSKRFRIDWRLRALPKRPVRPFLRDGISLLLQPHAQFNHIDHFKTIIEANYDNRIAKANIALSRPIQVRPTTRSPEA